MVTDMLVVAESKKPRIMLDGVRYKRPISSNRLLQADTNDVDRTTKIPKKEVLKKELELEQEARDLKVKEEMELNGKQEDKEDVELDSILSRFKLLGPTHLQFFILVSIIGMTNEMYYLNYIFVAEDVNYRCKYQCENTNENLTELLQNSPLKDDRCRRYELLDDNGTCTMDNFNANTTVECKEWVYDAPNSFVADFKIECEDWKLTTLGTLHCGGYMLGQIIVGIISDRIGRKKTIIFNWFISGVLGVARSFTKTYWIYALLEMSEGTFGDMFTPLYAYIIETTTTERRVRFTVINDCAYTVGNIILTVIAWSFPYRNMLLRVMYGPVLILCFVYWFLLDESVRWLLSTGRKKEAISILKKYAKRDNIKLDDEELNRLKCGLDKPNTDFVSLIKVTVASKKLLFRFLGCTFMWIVNSFSYQVLLINSVKLQGNKYINFGLVSSMSFFAIICLTLILTKFKRKKPLITTFLLTGVFCTIQPFVPRDFSTIALLVYLAGKFMSSMTGTIINLYTMEIFPTYTRNTMSAMCTALGQVAAVLGPQTPLLNRYWEGLPALLVGSLSLTAGLLCFIMPDSADNALPDTVHEAEGVGVKPSATLNKDKNEERARY